MKYLWTLLILAGLAPQAQAAEYFIRDAIAENVSSEQADAATSLVRSAVAADGVNSVVANEAIADYVLQPKLLKLGDSYVLTVEKKRGTETLYASQAKASSFESLDRAARTATVTAINEPPTRATARQLASSSTPSTDNRADIRANEPMAAAPFTAQPAGVAPMDQPMEVNASSPVVSAAPAAGTTQASGQQFRALGAKKDYWTVGIGPFISRHLRSDDLMYDIGGGHVWDIHPQASIKAMAEANFSSGKGAASYYNLSGGVNYFLYQAPGMEGAPYLTGDIGYGHARTDLGNTAEGFSFGTGIGYQFFRTSATTLDLLLRLNMIASVAEDNSYPSVLGARLAVNF
jgi:hypothetical protein